MDRVKNKVAVVTGGSSGIGKAISMLLASEGAKVAIVDLHTEEGKMVKEKITQQEMLSYFICEPPGCDCGKVCADIIKNKGIAEFWHMDVTNEKEINSVFAEIESRFKKIDVLVNNAGIAGASKPTHEISLEDWQKVISINQNGVFLCTKTVIPYMQKNKAGSIINISSIYGIVGAPDAPPYHAAKGAVRIMSKTDAMFYAKDNIRVNSVHPGFIWTPMLENYAKQLKTTPEAIKKQLGELHPIGHIGEPLDVAYGVLYLASEESKFITGSELVIDGGYTAR